MSYPTQANTTWERHPQAKLLPPRKQAINRPGVNDVGEPVEDELPQFEPLQYWNQILLCPCNSPTVCLYSLFCCCCAMGDIGCVIHDTCCCYVAYCVCAMCPCGIGTAREAVAEKYNLPVDQWEPGDCAWCLLTIIGARLLCVASVCLFPCFHVAQMRAEVAYREHGEATVCPCCCFITKEGGGPVVDDTKADYPRNGESIYAGNEKEPARPVADYPHEGVVGAVHAPEPQNVIMPPQNAIMQQPQNAVMQQPQNAIMQQPQNAIMQQPQNAIMQQPQNMLVPAPAMYPTSNMYSYPANPQEAPQAQFTYPCN